MKKYGYLVIYEIKGALTILQFLWTNRLELVENSLMLSAYLVDKKKLEIIMDMVEKAKEEQDEASVKG